MKKKHFSLDLKTVQNSSTKKALEIAESGVNAVLPKEVIAKNLFFSKNSLRVDDTAFSINGDLYVIGGGKASGMMAQAIEKILPIKKIKGGIVNSSVEAKTRKIKVKKASHPIPNNSGVTGTKAMLKLTENVRGQDLVLCLISGGGSALLVAPVENISLKEMQQFTKHMIVSGAEVYETQKVRKHLSQVKGGKLAEHLFPARVIVLAISDLVNPQDVVAAGPLEPDKSTFKEALAIIKKYRLPTKKFKNIWNYLQKGASGVIPETPKLNSAIFEKVETFTLANYTTALKSMAKKAQSLGYTPLIRKTPLLGGVQSASKEVANEIIQLATKSKKPTAYLYSSELVVTVNGQGKGGRCQEHAARVAQELGKTCSYTLASIGSDGIDYLDGVAGAIIDQHTSQQWINQKIDVSKYLRDNDSYRLHKIANSLVRGKKTGTNVGDLNICLIEK